jgi:hypothetical protein
MRVANEAMEYPGSPIKKDEMAKWRFGTEATLFLARVPI